MKKLVLTLLAVAMVLIMGMSALATSVNNGKITITNAVVDETYTIYRLLDLVYYNTDYKAYAYKATAKWEEWLKTQNSYVAFDDQGYVTWVYGADPAEFAKAAKEYAVEKNIANEGFATAESKTLVFDNLALGYYLVDTTLGTLCSLDTTDPSVNIEEKNEEPTITKEVQEDLDGKFGDSNDADMTQTVNFKTIVTAKKGAEGYIVHDILSNGLDLKQDSIAIEGLTKGTEYTVYFNEPCKDKEGKDATCDFHIVFEQAYLDTLKDNQQIVNTYSATLNADADVGLPGNPNDTRLQYANDNWTKWVGTVTYTWDLEVLKYGNGSEKNVLAGAKFVLLNKNKNSVAIFANGKFKCWEELSDEVAEWPADAELTTDAYGKIEVEGLDADTYYLRETEAPLGYNTLTNDIEVTIQGAFGGAGDTLSYETEVVEINNQSGTRLPETGAAGTMMFVAVGSLVTISAVVFMVTRKKMSIYEDR